MELNLKGKKVLITGSSKGIGKGIAEAFLLEGAIVMVNSRRKIDLSIYSGRSDSNLFSTVADVTTKEGRESIVNEVESSFNNEIDILVCNVGDGKSVPPGEELENDWDYSFKMNLFSTTNIIESVMSKITKGNGSIICISSICGLEALGAPLPYSAAKSALNSYVNGLSRTLGSQSIRINSIAPGNILFQGSTWESKIQKDKESVYKMIKQEVPLNKFGSVEDIANMALYLASDKANFITGTTITIDGGQVRR